ncbi:MAG: ABC transporter ATP-binding protein, partial [SAR324 cluster bacterium]|nr:ABC transporter ATP-binding protein [SAR324 cluster bacterium]
MERSTYKSFKALIRASWKATAQQRFGFYAFLFLFVVANTFDLLVPVTLGYVFGVLVKTGYTPEGQEQALIGISLYVACKLCQSSFHHLARYIQNIVTYSAKMFTYSQIFEALLSFPLNWHSRHHSGESLSKLHRSAGAIDQTIGTYIWQVVEGSVKVVSASIAICALDWWVALNVVLMYMLTIGLMIFFNSQLVRRIRLNNRFYDRFNRIFVDYLTNIVTVKTLNLEKSAHDYLSNQQPEGLKISKSISRLGELKWGSVDFGNSIVVGTSLIIYFYSQMNQGLAFDIARVYILTDYLGKIFAAIGSFTAYYSGLIESSTAYEDADEIATSSAEFRQTSSVPAVKEWDSIQIRNLEFFYDNEARTGLRNVNLDIKNGEKIALVGPSGGGKSTVLKIIGGLLEPTSYGVFSDSKHVLTLQQITKMALLLPQEPEIFSETLLYNLCLDQTFAPERIHMVASICRLERILEKLPRGWDNSLAEKGLNMSVGEKQRVALARCLLRAYTRDILLLDEPTSSLDPKTEKEIFIGILEHFSKLTVLSACHRLNLVPLFDRIIYVRDGLIEEQGSFEQLLAK